MLSPEQQAIVEAPPEVRMLVTAGPGTGKTFTLIARLAHLVQTEGLSPGQEILVLSFARAAVSLIRERLAAAGGDVRFVRAVTFDSFATALLSQIRPDGPWVNEGYDGRIREATKLILEDPEAKSSLAQYQHVLIDETQDIVGGRAEFIKAILLNVPGGFTVLGDPAQGIYAFQLPADDRALKTGELYRWIRETFTANLVERQLALNYRAKTKSARSAIWLGDELNSRSPRFDWIAEQLRTVLLELKSVGDVGTAQQMLRNPKVRTAILCRTNGQVLMISRELHKLGIAHQVQRAATDRVVSPWLALAFADLEFPRVGKRDFLERVAALHMLIPEAPEPERAWRLLKRIDRRTSDDIDTQSVAERVRIGNLPDDLNNATASILTVSTIHRAKGLEFPRVLVVDPELKDDPEDVGEEARILYVALTRPSEELFYMKPPNTRGAYCPQNGEDRWVRRRTKWMTNDIEVKGDDADSTHPAGALFVKDADPKGIQTYMRTIRPGDPVSLGIIKHSEDGQPRVSYAIKHNERVVGVTSDHFGASLLRMLKISPSWRVSWPLRIDDLHVEALDSVAGTAAMSHKCGLGISGIWLRVRVAGFGDLVFENSHNV